MRRVSEASQVARSEFMIRKKLFRTTTGRFATMCGLADFDLPQAVQVSRPGRPAR